MSDTDDAAARELIRQQVEQHGGLVIFAEEAEHVSGLAERLSDRIIAALRKAGHLRTPGTVEVVLDDLEMAVEWMDQTDNPWPGELFSETGVAADIAKDQIKSAIYNHYAALAAGADELAAGAAASSSGTERVR